MKKIVIISRRSMTINLFCKDLIQYLSKKNIDIKLCCNDISNLKVVSSKNINFTTLNSMNKFSIIFDFFKLIKELNTIGKKYNDHIFIINTPLISHLFRISTLFLKLKIIYFVHGYRFHNKGNFFSNLIFKVFEIILSINTTAYININDYDYNFTNSIINKKSIKVNGIGIDLQNRYQKKNILNKDFTIGIIAAYKKNKGYDDLIKICKNKNLSNKAKFICYGYGDYNKYLKKINESNINNLILNDFTDNIYSVIDKFDVVLHLSYREGLPVSLMQSLIRGKPVICYNVRGCVDLIKNNFNGYIIDIGDINKVIESINFLISNKNLLVKFSSNALNSINETYSHTYISKKIHELIIEV